MNQLFYNIGGGIVHQIRREKQTTISEVNVRGVNNSATPFQEARVALGYCLGQLLRFFRALQTSHVLHNSIVHN